MKYTKNVLLALACLAFYGTLQAVNAAAPGKPTLRIAETTAIGDLSLGADYTLLCISVPVGNSFEFFKDGSTTALTATLTAVSTVTTAGRYTCQSTNGDGTSVLSDAITIAVGAAGKICAAYRDCLGTVYVASCSASRRCDCATDYEADKAVCIATIPPAPTLAINGGTTGDLSEGAEYTLVCTTAHQNLTTKFYKDGNLTALTSGILTAVSATKDNGAYTCKASNTATESDASNIITITVGAAGKICAGNSECTGTEYIGTCSVSDRCDCATDYEVDKAVCIATKPTAPTLAINGGTTGDLSEGAEYTLVCTAPPGLTTKFYKDGNLTALTSGILTAVSATKDNGAYTCKASNTATESDASNIITITVGAAGKICAGNSECTGTEYIGTCSVSDRCDCATDYEVDKAVCIATKPTAPTLAINGGTTGDLSEGAEYTLVCTTAPPGLTTKFYKDGSPTALASDILTAVSATKDNGAYTCKASNTVTESDASNAITIAVGAAGKLCTTTNEATDCAGTPYAGTCPINRCDCAADYKVDKAVCIVKVLPVAPTLSIKDDTAVVGDLSKGAEYTLVCTADPVGLVTTLYKDNAQITSAKLTSVSTKNTNGAYTCKATNTDGMSPASNSITVVVGAAGKKCDLPADCKGVANAKEECTDKRCTCKNGYNPEKATCNVAVPMTTFSVITFITAFIASKLV